MDQTSAASRGLDVTPLRCTVYARTSGHEAVDQSYASIDAQLGSLLGSSSNPVGELVKPTHAQLVVAQADVRVLRRKSWQRFRENRGQ